ncbi:hypothetical protein [Falsiroseomonas sp. CW058]|uniref:hypothetical protein n=1 Tax=Falsiroseomonas sp. CW058 TaxID=3388664 RepID=UPI003D3175B1
MRAALLLPVLTVVACAPGPGEGPGTRPGGAALPLDAAVARLPANVAGFTRGDAAWHERDTPGLGAAVDYAGPARSAVATVSLYDRGQAVTPGDPASPRVQGEFAAAVADAVATAGTRTSQQITERERSELPVPGGPALSCARLSGTYGRQEVRTLLCLGTADGRFLKVQVTAPARQVRPVDPIPFVIGIAQAARGQG